MRPVPSLVVAAVVLAGVLALALIGGGEERGVRGPSTSAREVFDRSAELVAGPLDSSARPAARGTEPGEREALAERPAPRFADVPPPLVHGVAHATDGRPLEDVVVHLVRLPRDEGSAPVDEARTDEGGAFAFEGVEEEVLLVLQREGLLPRWIRARPDERLAVELREARTLAGVVLDAGTRRPLAGVGVSARTRHFDGVRLREHVASRTGEDGRWELPFVEVDRTVRLQLDSPGLVRTAREVQVRRGTDDDVVLLLGEGPLLGVRTVELATGASLGDVALRVDGQLVGTTDADGFAAHREDLEAGRRARELRARYGAGPETVVRWEPERRHADRPATLPLFRGSRVVGRVTDEGGEPVAGARVVLSALQAPAKLGDAALRRGAKFEDLHDGAWTDDTGAFELDGLYPRAGRVALRVSHPDHEPLESEEFELAHDDAEVRRDLRLVVGATVFGLVTFDGTPYATKVRWTADGRRGDGRSNDRGEFTLSGLPAGVVEVHAELPGRVAGRSCCSKTYDLHLAPGEERRLDLPIPGDRVPIAGTVRTLAGAPLGGVRVEARGRSPEFEPLHFRAETGPDGAFELQVLAEPGVHYRVDAVVGSERVVVERVVPDTLDLDLRFEEQGGLLLSVRDAVTGALVEDLDVHWRRAGRVGERRGWRAVAKQGRRLVHGAGEALELRLPLGRVDLLVAAPRGGYAAVEVLGLEVLGLEVARTPEGARPVLLEPGTRLELAFLDAEGRPRRPRMPGGTAWRIERLAEEGTPEAALPRWAREHELEIDDRGRAVLPGVAPGRWRVRPPRGVPAKAVRPRSFQVEPSDLRRVTLRIDEESAR